MTLILVSRSLSKKYVRDMVIVQPNAVLFFLLLYTELGFWRLFKYISFLDYGPTLIWIMIAQGIRHILPIWIILELYNFCTWVTSVVMPFSD
jgi:hypothetical protein